MESSYTNGPLNLMLGASFITGKNSRTGTYLTNIAPLKLTSNLSYAVEILQGVVGWKATLSDDHEDVNSAGSIRPAYTVHDLYYSWMPEHYQNVTLDLGVDNLFDEAYSRVFANSLEPGRNYKIQLGIRF